MLSLSLRNLVDSRVKLSAACFAVVSIWYGTRHIYSRKRTSSTIYNGSGKTAALPGAPSGTMTSFRVLCVNDVYTIESLARLKVMLPQYTLPGKSMLTLNGDFLGGFPLAVKTQGEAMVCAMNQLAFDVVVLGNHEFDYGRVVLEERIAEANFQWLGANVVDKETRQRLQGVDDVMVRRVPTGKGREVVVGLFGVCTEMTPKLSYPGETVEFTNVIDSALHCVRKLESMGADVIIGLTHVSMATDRLIAAKVPGINMLLGGHDHTPMATMEGDTLIFKCGQNCEYLGVVDLQLVLDDNGDCVRVSPSWSMIDTSEATEVCGDVMKVIESYADNSEASKEELVRVRGTPIASTTALARTRGCTFGYMVADALCHHHNSDIGLINGGFLRGNMEYPVSYPLTKKDIMNELPFPREAMCVRLTGNSLLKALDQQLAYLPAASGAFIHVSKGWELTYNPTLPPGERVQSLNKNGIPIDRERVYTASLTAFMAGGGDGCDGYQEGQVVSSEESHLKVNEVVLQYLRGLGGDYHTETHQRLVSSAPK